MMGHRTFPSTQYQLGKNSAQTIGRIISTIRLRAMGVASTFSLTVWLLA
jgi:hypothetical protein